MATFHFMHKGGYQYDVNMRHRLQVSSRMTHSSLNLALRPWGISVCVMLPIAVLEAMVARFCHERLYVRHIRQRNLAFMNCIL